MQQNDRRIKKEKRANKLKKTKEREREWEGVCVWCCICGKGVWITSRTNFNNMSLCPALTTQLPHWMLMSLSLWQQDSLKGHEVTGGVGWSGRSICVFFVCRRWRGVKALGWMKGVLHSCSFCAIKTCECCNLELHQSFAAAVSLYLTSVSNHNHISYASYQWLCMF